MQEHENSNKSILSVRLKKEQTETAVKILHGHKKEMCIIITI